MGTILKATGVILGFVAAFLMLWSNTDSARLFYKCICCKKLSGGIDKLFQPTNKYVSKNAQERTVGWQKFFYLQKDKDPEFDTMEEFILKNIRSKRDIYRNVKIITQYQAQSLTSDVTNMNFTFRPIFFIKQTTINKNLDFTDTTYKLMMADAVLVMSEETLTQDLDNYLSNSVRMKAFWFIIMGTLLNLVALIPAVKS